METTPVFTRSQIRIANFKNNRIEHKLICRLIVKFKKARNKNPDAPMPEELGEVFLALIEKVIWSNNWRGYSPDWHEEFRGLSLVHLCKYSIGFDPAKSTDACNYFYTMITRAFMQALKKCKTHSDYEGETVDAEVDYAQLTYTPEYF